MTRSGRWWLRAYPPYVGITLLNFVVWVALTIHFGGDAVNGRAIGGHYFLWGYNGHTGVKGYTEVTAGVYRYSLVHTYITLIMWVVMLVPAFWMAIREVVSRRKRRAA